MTGAGIYAIRNIVSGRIYVGSTVNLRTRWNSHRYLLRYGKHHSASLQRSWDKHGAQAFDWSVLELVDDPARLFEREQHWMDKLDATNVKTGFNMAPNAGKTRGITHTPESTRKRLATLAARSPEEKAATAAKLAAARLGYKHSPETLAKMRGQKRRDETKQRIGEAHRGRPKSEQQRARISATLMGRKYGPQSPETIAKRVAATLATKAARKSAA